jgi:hypothetical protein
MDRHATATTRPAQLVDTPTASTVERFVGLLLPSLADVLFIVAFLGVALSLQGRALGQDGDIGWHIRLGLRTLSGDLPRTDTFSSTAYGRPLVGMEWLAEVCYALVWRMAGLNGVVLLAGLLIGGVTAGLYLVQRARGIPILVALPLTLAGTALTSIHWVARPHLFSLVLTLWWSDWLWRYWRDGRRSRLLVLPPVMILWVNLHGGFVGGLILLGTAVAVAWLFPGSSGHANRRELSITLLVCLLCTGITPWGWSWVGYFLAYFRDPLVTAYTQELQSPDFHSLVGRLFLALLLLLAASWIFGGHATSPAVGDTQESGGQDTGSNDAPEPLAWATAGVWTIIACTAVRGVPLWAVVVIPLLGESVTSWLRRLAAHPERTTPSWIPRLVRASLRRSQRLAVTERLMGRGIWAGLAIAGIVALVANGGMLPGGRAPLIQTQFSPRDFPVEAVARLRTTGLPTGRGFNTVEWGGYLTYALPEYHVFIDSRSDFYGEAVLRDYLTILDVGPAWQRTLDAYHVQWALLPLSAPVAGAMEASDEWSCRAMDRSGVAILCLRTGAAAR